MGSVKTMKDFLGKEYGPGDIVLYSSGSSMGFGEVRRITDLGNVTLYPIKSSGSRGMRTILLDKRTGARVSPYNKEHQARPRGYVHRPTGKFYTSNEHTNYLSSYGYDFWSHPEHKDFDYAKEVYKPYVFEVEIMDYPVTIYNTRNILKWEGPVPSGEAE